ncbi:hypothetical protein T10_1083 [Trichinella papuae]|uniref:Uncharacterized protein n=1 Tax=Trichinella papuae TaxID=268474 RepID=A0A0V1N1G1_9BILA|nr:hypothetical protein T10_1083 [Trichinella papuae]
MVASCFNQADYVTAQRGSGPPDAESVYTWPTQSGDFVEAELKSPPKLVKHRRSDLKGRTTHSLNTWNVAGMRMMQWIVDGEVRNNDHQKWMDFELEVLSTCADYFTRWAEDFTRYQISRRTQWSSALYAVWLPGQRAL